MFRANSTLLHCLRVSTCAEDTTANGFDQYTWGMKLASTLLLFSERNEMMLALLYEYEGDLSY